MKKVKVGVVGVGYLGKFHAEKYAKMDQVDLVGVCDANKEVAEDVAKKMGTTPYANHKDLIGKVDAVSIVVPTPLHFKVCEDFLENGVDLLIEKPITTRLEDANELIRMAASNDLIIQVGHLERYNPAVIALNDVVKDPIFIEAHRLCKFQERGTDVSVVLDLMIHDIDLVLKFIKSSIINIEGAGIRVASDHVDFANARLEFENGSSANITASRISGRNERGMRIVQKDAYISVDYSNHQVAVTRNNKKQRSDTVPELHSQALCFEKTDALEDELRAFVNSVIQRTPPEVSGQVGQDALKAALDITDKINDSGKRFGL